MINGLGIFLYGPSCFDVQEPNYGRSMARCFETIIRNIIGRKMKTFDIICIHNCCISGVYNCLENKCFQLDFRKKERGVRFGMIPKKITPAAYREWETEKLIYIIQYNSPKEVNCEDYLGMLLERNSYGWVYCHDFAREQIEQKLNQFLEEYYTAIECAQTSCDKLSAIARLCRSIKILHPFSDGNQRTIAFALLTKLLLENDFSPAILKDPCMFDGYYSTQEMVEKIEEGMDIFQNPELWPEVEVINEFSPMNRFY